MSVRWRPEQVFLYRYPVDMRKQIDGLSALVVAEFERDPADRSAYLFVSRCGRRVKLLIWHLNGFWLLYKRLESERFHWPDWFGENAVLELDAEQFEYLLDGYDLNGMRPHRTQTYARHF